VNVLYHHRTRGEDAQGIHIRALCDAFGELGHSVTLVGPPRLQRGDSRASNDHQAGGTRLLGLRVPSWAYELAALAYNVPAFLWLVAAMLRRRPDLVYERYALFGVAGRLAAGVFRIPFVLEVNAPLSLEMSREHPLAFHGLAQRLENWLCRSSTRTIVVSRSMARILEAQGAAADRLWVVPNGVDREDFHPAVDGRPVRDALGLEDRFVVGFVGWVRPWHGVDRLVKAAARLRERIPNLVVLIVGDGPARPGLEALARAEGISDAVRFTGALAQSEIPAHVAAMDVAVQPDVTEYASPIKLFEYLALGRAIVAPRKENITEIVSDGQHALLFEPGSTDEMAACIDRLHGDSELRRLLEQRAARLITDREYTWVGNARRVAALAERPGAQPA
jgi:glycosyltransferase involved in cell wall biosynthesis